MSVITKQKPIIFHFRGENKPAKGGITIVFDPKCRSFGVAVCSKKDQFCRRMGVRIAHGRAQSSPSKVRRDDKPLTFEEVAETADSLAKQMAEKFEQSIITGDLLTQTRSGDLKSTI